MSIKVTRIATLQCDSGKCASFHGVAYPTTFTWDEEKAQQDPMSLPDDFFRLLTLEMDVSKPQRLVFCCPTCLKDFLTYEYRAAKSPREVAAEQSAQIKKDNPHLVQKAQVMDVDDATKVDVAKKIVSTIVPALKNPETVKSLKDAGYVVDELEVSRLEQKALGTLMDAADVPTLAQLDGQPTGPDLDATVTGEYPPVPMAGEV